MEVHHKSHAIKNWRELMSEVGIIVIGVLIALGAEQGVEAMHWSHKVEQAEVAMRLELVGDDGPQAFARASSSECLRDQLTKMRTAVEAGVDRRVFHDMAAAYKPPIRTWDDQAWRAVVASDVGTHMGAERLIQWSSPYLFMPLLQQTAAAELQNQVELKTGRTSSGPLSDAEVDRLLLVIDNLVARNRAMAGWSLGMLASMEDVGAGLSDAEKRKLLADNRRVYGSCVVTPETDRFRTLGRTQTKNLDSR